MPTLHRFAFRFAICFATIVLASFQQVSAQEDSLQDTATSSPNPVNSQVLFSGESPKTIEELRFMESHFAELAERVKPATVNIQMGAAQGSGVVVSSDGYIMTAAHVIGGPNRQATITFPDQTQVIAESLGVHSRLDSGLLKIRTKQGEEPDFPYLDIGLSDDLKKGQWVMAIGHPGGIDEKRGLVIRVGRINITNERLIRTDCTLVGGDSGGPLVDMNGDVIGIHSRIGSTLLQNLHVPADVYTENWDRMAKGIVLDGSPWLGIELVDQTNTIKSVVQNGPAEKAGIKKDDVLLKIGAVEIKTATDVRDAVKSLDLRPNSKVDITIERDEEEQTLELTVGANRRARRRFLGR